MPLSQSALQAVLASATDKAFLECLRITHSDLNPLLLVNDTQNLNRSEGTFLRFPFRVSADVQGSGPPAILIDADAVNQTLVIALRSLAGKKERAQITYDIVLADSPNTVEFGPMTFEFDSVSGSSATQVQVRASVIKGAFDDAFPAMQFSPSNAQ